MVESFDSLVARSYGGLKVLARSVLREHLDAARLADGPSSIVHEAVGRIASQDALPESEAHLRGLMTITMRRVLSDRRRRQDAAKRGGDRRREELDASAAVESESVGGAVRRGESSERAQAALAELLRCEPRCGETLVLSLRTGVTTAQLAELLGVGTATVERDLRFARAWIAAWLAEEDPR